MKSSVKAAAFVAALVACVAVTRPVGAEEPAAEAARHYDEGAAALRKGDLRAAGRAFAEADRVAPHPTTLAEALRAALDAGDEELLRDLVARAQTRGRTPEIDRLVAEAQRATAHASARARVTLDGPAECSLDDGARDAVLTAGAHTVTVRCPDVTAPTTLSLTGGETRVLRVSYRDRRGPPLYVPLATAGLSLAALTVGLLRGAAASSKHDELEAAGCATRGSDACRDIASGGRAAELQANVSYVVAGVLGAATIGLFVWHRRGEITLAPSPRQATLRLAVAWP